MARLYVLIKRKGSKKWLGAIPAKSGTTKAQLKKSVSQSIKSGFSYSIVTSSQLKRLILRQSKSSTRPKRTTTKKRKVIKRRKPTKRKTTRRKKN